ncbi:JAB domain-containing protein [Epilithonimonas caeni]|uniref:JAB domain-containing protein n=1 Tax=Epilithonimonas caeni TaxID=365343 RepID=UPI00068759DC|nr:JAB domain-containing protein [Epilithonimonas caeni]
MQIKLEIGKYSEGKDLGGFQKMEFSSIDEAIANIEFLKLGYDSFKNGESLVIRSGKGTKPYLLDYDSTIPILQLRRELEEKYNTAITQDNEIQFKTTTKPKKESLNSNFSFSEDRETLYAKTTTRASLPFKLFRTDDTGAGSNIPRQSENPGESTDFALIERRFSENNSLQFFGSEKIENHNDIAWLFKSLEDEAVEHAFLVYDFEDKGYFVQHISTGSYNAALIDNKQIIGNIIEANPNSITLVHNHPSGNLKASKADANVLEKLKKALQNTDVKVNDGIIINLRSGNYLIFNEKLLKELKHRTDVSQPLSEIQAYSFSKQVLVENFQPIKVKSPEEVAAYITSQKFGVSDKNEMLVLNSQLNIIGKFILPANNQENFIIEKVSKFGGSSCVLYGNNITPELVDFYSKRLEHSNITITDAILLKSENGQKMWESFMNEGKMRINSNANTDSLSENYTSKFNTMEKNELSWSDRVITPKTNAYKEFINEMINSSPEIFFRDGDREFTDKEKKYMQIYSEKGKDIVVDSNFSLKTIFDNDTSKATAVESKFNSNTQLAVFINSQKMTDRIFVVQDNSNGIEITLNNEADKQKFLSDVWAKELTKQTDLSSGMTKTQIDEKQAYHFRNYEFEAKKLGIEIIPFIEVGEQKLDIQNKASEIVSILNNNEKTLMLDATTPGIAKSSTEVDSLEGLIKNMERHFMPEGYNKSISIRPYGEHLKPPIFQTTDKDVKNELVSSLKEILNDRNLLLSQEFSKEHYADSNALYSKEPHNNFLEDYFDDIDSGFLNSKKNETEIIGGKIKDIAAEAIRNPGSLKQYDGNTQNTIQIYINKQNPQIMETTQKEFDQVEYLKAQFRYLGFGDSEKLHKDLEAGINSQDKEFEVKTTSDKAMPGNTVEYSIKFSKSEQGGVFLNSYDATLNNGTDKAIVQNFKVSKDNYFTAKEAVNLLEGRSVKIEFDNPKTNQRESSFVKLDLNGEKNQWGNYNFQKFHQNYGVDTSQIVDKSNLIFDKPEYKDNTIKSLEKGNVVKVKFEIEDKVIEGKAVLNPQYKNLNLYDNDMNRINTNKPIQGLDNDNKHEKSNVREQSISRGI